MSDRDCRVAAGERQRRIPPRELYGKSITVTWTETRSQRNAGEEAFRPVSIPYTFTAYVGTAGTVFRRIFAVAASGAPAAGQDRVGKAPTDDGSASASWSGRNMTSTSSFGGAARRMQITFDGAFSSCTAEVVTAKLASEKYVRVKSIATGGFVEFESVSAGAASCAIATGNPFAN